jgi:hypothetical protein
VKEEEDPYNPDGGRLLREQRQEPAQRGQERRGPRAIETEERAEEESSGQDVGRGGDPSEGFGQNRMNSEEKSAPGGEGVAPAQEETECQGARSVEQGGEDPERERMRAEEDQEDSVQEIRERTEVG